MAPIIEVLSPAGSRIKESYDRSSGLAILDGKIAGMLSNSKSNADAFLSEVGNGLISEFGVEHVVAETKYSVAKGVDSEQLARLQGADFVVTAFAD